MTGRMPSLCFIPPFFHYILRKYKMSVVGMSQPAHSTGMNMWTRTQKPHFYSIFGHSHTTQGTKFTAQFRSSS